MCGRDDDPSQHTPTTIYGYGEAGHPFDPDRYGRCRKAGAGYCGGTRNDPQHDKRAPGLHTISVLVQSVVRDEGTIVVFAGFDVDTDLPVMFAADHRPAYDIADAIRKGEGPIVTVELWQVIG